MKGGSVKTQSVDMTTKKCLIYILIMIKIRFQINTITSRNHEMKKIGLMCIIALLALSACKSKEEQKNEAESEAKFLAEKKARIAKGVGEAMKGEGKDAADSLSEGVGEVIKGGASGFDKSLSKINIELDKDLKDKGIEIGRAARLEQKNDKGEDGVTAYLIYNKPFKGTLLIKAFDPAGKEIGRATAQTKGGADDTSYVNFYFDQRTPLTIVKKFTLKQKM